MISAIKVLNSVTALGTDVSVGSDGIVNIASVETVDAYNLRGVSVTVPQTEVSGIVTITPTEYNLTQYNFYINAFSMSTGLPKVINVSFVSSSGATPTSISNQARAIINADADLSVSASGTTTIVLTAKPTQPFFVVGGTVANIDSYSSASATTIFSGASGGSVVALLSATNTGGAGVGVAGRAVRGSVAYLQNKYAYSANGNTLTQSELALLTPGFFYTEVVINYITTTPSGSGAFKGEISTLEAVVLVRANTDGSSTAFTTTNYADLLGSYGTITGLQAGYRVSGIPYTAASVTAGISGTIMTVTVGSGLFAGLALSGASVSPNTQIVSQLTGVVGGAGTYLLNVPSTVAPSSTITSGTVTIASNLATFTSATTIGMGILAGDFMVADPSGTPSSGYILALSAGASAGAYSNTRVFATNADETTVAYNIFKWRPLPV
jgi:hypothetical protein